MARKILLGDAQVTGKYLGVAYNMLDALKLGMSASGIDQSYTKKKYSDAEVKVERVFGQDTIRITELAPSSIFKKNLIFATEWGLQGFEMINVNGNITLTPKDIQANPDDVFSMLANAYVERDIYGALVWVLGSAVSSIDRENQRYTFKVPKSQQDIITGMAYELYADKIRSYGTKGFLAIVGGIYAGISEEASAGTDLVYTPFSTGVTTNPTHGQPYESGIGLMDTDAGGRRPYELDFVNSKIKTSGEYVQRSRLVRIPEEAWISSIPWDHLGIVNTPTKEQLDELLAPWPGVAAESAARTTINGWDNTTTDPYTCEFITYWYAADRENSFNTTITGSWWSLYNYQELMPKETDLTSFELVTKRGKLFENKVVTELSIQWKLFPKLNWVGQCLPTKYTYNEWGLDSYLAISDSERYDVRASLGKGKFIYDEAKYHNVLHYYDVPYLYGYFLLHLSYALETVIDNNYSGIIKVYIGDWIFKTNYYTRRYQQTYPYFDEPWTSGEFGQSARNDPTSVERIDTEVFEETFFMDYDFDKEHGENGVFFYQNVKTETTTLSKIGSGWDPYGPGAYNVAEYDKKETFDYGVVIILNNSPQIIPLSNGYVREMKSRSHTGTAFGADPIDEPLSYLASQGQRIWLTSSYISDKEMVFSYLLEDVDIKAALFTSLTQTMTPVKRVTTFINLANEGMPFGYQQSFETLPIASSAKPNFTITKKQGSGGGAHSLQVMVVAMTTINMSEPKTPVELELANDEYFNVSYPKVEGASHYAIFIAPTTPPLIDGGGNPIEWFKPIITAELSIDITEALLAASGNDTRNMSMQGSSYNILKHGDLNFSTTNIKSPKLVPAIGIHKTEVTV